MNDDSRVPDLAALMVRPQWMQDALCREPAYSHVNFFPERGQTRATREAKAVCAQCQVRAACLDYALSTPFEKFGIWGGVSELKRRGMRRGQPRTKQPKPEPRPREKRTAGIPRSEGAYDDGDPRYDVRVLHDAGYAPAAIAARLSMNRPMVDKFLAEIAAEDAA